MKTACKWLMRVVGILLILLSFAEVSIRTGADAADPCDPDADEDILI